MKINSYQPEKKQSGFTIIELLIASIVFSIIMMIALYGILRVTQLYYKGVASSRTQEVTRSVIDELSESIRFTNSDVVMQSAPLVRGPKVDRNDPADTNYFCIGQKRYTYAVDRQLKSNPNGPKEKRHVLWADIPISGCSGPANLNLDLPSAPADNGRELVGENMRIAQLDVIEETNFGRKAYTINISIAYGDGDDDEPNYGGSLSITPDGLTRTCQSINSPFVGQFCSVSSVSVTAERRLQ